MPFIKNITGLSDLNMTSLRGPVFFSFLGVSKDDRSSHKYLAGRVLQASLSSSSDGGRDDACEKPSSSELCEWFRGT